MYLGKYILNFLAWMTFALVLSSCNVVKPVEFYEQDGNKYLGRCAGKTIDKNSPNTIVAGLVTPDKYLYEDDCYVEVLTKILKNSNEPVVLFVHGRGEHPSKTIKNKLMERLKEQYGVLVLMFTWPSWEGELGFPVIKARNSGGGLEKLIKDLLYAQEVAEHKYPLSLLTQSMGSVVLEGMVAKNTFDSAPGNIFKNVIISASASDFDGHGLWARKIHFSNEVYVVNNKNDKALLCSEGKPKFICGFVLGFDMKPKLGRVGKGDMKSFTSNVHYVDFSEEVGGQHRYYINQEKELDVYDFYKNLLNGRQL